MNKKKFTLLGKVISVNLEMAGGFQSNNYVLTDRFRPDEIKRASHGMQSQTEESEFRNDINFLINEINKTGTFDRNSLIASLKKACKHHIQQFNRIIDTDLYTYIDCSMHILEATNNLNKSDLKPVYIGYANLLFGEFKDYIYVAKPPIGMVKLTDLMNKR
jgi:hypothetical protein